MTDPAAPFLPGREPGTAPFRSRSEFAGYKAFGSGGGAVLIDLGTERRLRSAAELATQQRRVAGGLLFGHGWTDDQGSYLVIGGFLEAGPGESGDRAPAGDPAEFTLSAADLRLLREGAARMYPASLEVGWWRTLPTLGEFGPRDLVTQAELVGPSGAGLLVYGSGAHWGTAYLGPDGHAPDTAGTLVTVADALVEPPPEPEPEPAADPGPELVDITAGEHLAEDPIPLAGDVNAVKYAGLSDAGAGMPLRQQADRRSSRRARRRAAATATAPPADVPRDVRLVVGALAVTAVVAAVIVGALLHSFAVALIIAAVALLLLFSGVWLSRYW